MEAQRRRLHVSAKVPAPVGAARPGCRVSSHLWKYEPLALGTPFLGSCPCHKPQLVESLKECLGPLGASSHLRRTYLCDATSCPRFHVIRSFNPSSDQGAMMNFSASQLVASFLKETRVETNSLVGCSAFGLSWHCGTWGWCPLWQTPHSRASY